MIIRIFRSTYQSQIIIILLFAVVLWLTAFINPPELPAALTVTPFQDAYAGLEGGWLMTLLALALMLVQGGLLTLISGNYRILGLTNLLPMLVYLIFMSFSKNYLTLNPALVSNLFVILFIRKLIANHGQREVLLEWFNASLLIGVAALFHPANLMLLLLLWTTFVIYRIYKLREWIISFLGILMVGLFYAFYLFWIEKLDNGFLYITDFYSGFPGALPDSLPLDLYAFLGVLAFLALITVPRMIFKLDENIIRTRKRLNVVIFHALLIVAGGLLFPDQWMFFMIQLFIPLSFTVSRLIANIRKEKIKDWVLMLLLVSIVYERIIDFLM